MLKTRTQQVTASAIGVMLFTALSKVVGFGREMLISYHFGIGMEADAFFMAMAITGVMVSILAAGFKPVMIPILTELGTAEEENRYINRLTKLLFIGSIIGVILLYFLAPLLIRIFARGFGDEAYELTVRLVRAGLPAVIAIIFNDLFNGYLQSREKFIFPAIVGIPFNIPYFIFLLLMTDRYGILGLMIAGVAGNALQCVLTLLYSRKQGWRYRTESSIKDPVMDPKIRKTFLLVGPVIMGTMVRNVNVIVDRALASGLVTGSVSALNYAEKIKSMVYGVFILTVATVLYPILAREGNIDEPQSFIRVLRKGVNVMVWLTLPISVGTILFAEPIVRVFFQRGEFDAWSTGMTSFALSFYAVGFVGIGIREILIRGFYSLSDTKTPMKNGMIIVVMNIALNLVLVRYLDHGGLALATGIASTLGGLLLLHSLRRKIGQLGGRRMAASFLRSALGCGLMALGANSSYHALMDGAWGITVPHESIALLGAVLSGVLIYSLWAYLNKKAIFE